MVCINCHQPPCQCEHQTTQPEAWEKTVLSDSDLKWKLNSGDYHIDDLKRGAQAQAKATWKAACQAERERILTWLKSFAKVHPNVVVAYLVDFIEASKPE